MPMQEQKKDTSLFSSIPIDKKNLVDNFSMIGWASPDAPNPQKALQWLRALKHDELLYPEQCYSDPKKPPSCIFVPETQILNKMIETVARTPNNKTLLF